MAGTQIEDATVYGRAEFQDVDIGAIMREGHPDIAEGDELIVSLIAERAGNAGRPLQIMDVGAGSGVLSELLARRLPEHRVIANDVEPAVIKLAEHRLSGLPNAEIFGRPFQEWNSPLDVVISWGSHHHLPNSYLALARRLLGHDGILVIGDEFCPEYCTPDDAARISAASVIHVADGFVLTSAAEVSAYERDRHVPAWAQALERRRREALWTWYKYVIDYAIERDCWLVALVELQIARDDLTTGFAGEHKLSPRIVERDLELNGFAPVSRHAIGDNPPQLQSFSVYEYTPAAGGES